jgi:hypothetical protein
MSEDAGAVDTLADLATAYISDDDTTPSFSIGVCDEEDTQSLEIDDEVEIRKPKGINKRSIDNLLRLDPLPNEKLEEIRVVVTSELKQENIRLRKQVKLLNDSVKELDHKFNKLYDDYEQFSTLAEQVAELQSIVDCDRQAKDDQLFPMQDKLTKVEGMNNRMYFWFKDMERRGIYKPPNPANGSLPGYATPPSPPANTTLGRISGGNATQNQSHWAGRGPKLGGRF